MRRESSAMLAVSVLLLSPLALVSTPSGAGAANLLVVKCGVGTPILDRVVVYVHNDSNSDASFRVRWLNRGGLTVQLSPIVTLSPGRIASEELGPLGLSPGNELVVAKVTASTDDVLIDAEVDADSGRRQLTCTPSNADPDELLTRGH